VFYTEGKSCFWIDESWGITVDYDNTSNTVHGSKSISIDYDTGWSGLYFYQDAGVDPSAYGYLQISFYGPSEIDNLYIETFDINRSQLGQTRLGDVITVEPNTWQTAYIPLSTLAPNNALINALNF
ncbi:unnamed protein product, partial [Laminaria digitata]